MRSGLRIGYRGIALVAAAMALGGCGGGSGGATDQVRTLGLGLCDVSEAEGALSGLKAGSPESDGNSKRRRTGPPGGTSARSCGR
jgi:hypothetical protein